MAALIETDVQTTSGPRVRATLCALLLAAVLCGWASAQADAHIYWASSHSIQQANVDGTWLESLISADDADSVAVDSAHLYWTNYITGAIWRASLDDGSVDANFITGGNQPLGVAVDAGHIYWANSLGNTIGRANLDGTGVNQSFITATEPIGMAVDGGHIYWANHQGNAIARANLDGTGVNQSFIAGASNPYAVAVDAGHVYWVNRDSGFIGRANLEGGSSSAGLAVDAGHVYWGNSGSATIGRANLGGTGVERNFITGVTVGGGIAVDARQSVAPTVATDAASSLTATGAALNSTINPGGSGTTYKLEYGPTTAFGTVLPAVGTFNAGFGSSPQSQPARAISGLSPGTTYYYRVCANNLVTGSGVANQVCGAVRAFTTSGTSAPSASTGAASAVTNTSAQVAGSVNAHGAATAYVVEYGTSTAFGQIGPVPSGNAGSGTASLPVSTTLSGLQPNTTYLYRLVAANSQGTTTGTVRSFITSGPPTAPAVTTGEASDVIFTSAMLNATIDPKGRPTAFMFEYGRTTAFDHVTAVDSAGSSGGAQQISVRVRGLPTGTRLLYRIVATNAAGTTMGAVMSFTTLTPIVSPPIFWTNSSTDSIGQAGPFGLDPNQSFIATGDSPQGITFEISPFDSSHIYWSNPNSIGRASFDGSDVNQNFITSLSSPAGVTFDDDHIYWAETGTGAIGRANLTGTVVNRQFITGASSPTGIAVDSGHVYWTNRDSNTIGRANLDGTGVDQSFITGANSPSGVAVDFDYVYWTNWSAGTIGRANRNGTGVDQSFITGATNPFGIAVDYNAVLWTNFNAATVGRSNLDGTGVTQSFVLTDPRPTGVAVRPSG